jgi:hypothetical protein
MALPVPIQKLTIDLADLPKVEPFTGGECSVVVSPVPNDLASILVEHPTWDFEDARAEAEYRETYGIPSVLSQLERVE